MRYDHLLSLTTPDGLHEHCDADRPLAEHGYCVDDVARALIVIARDGDAPEPVMAAGEIFLRFLEEAQSPDGTVVNRRTVAGAWTGPSSTDDHWGRALWAWGTVAHCAPRPDWLRRSTACFTRSVGQRSTYTRAMAHAALGAAEFLSRFPDDAASLALLADTRDLLLSSALDRWPWPEARLTYANAVVPQALMVAGHHLRDRRTRERGLGMLEWLVELQTCHDHLSVIGCDGWAPGEPLPAFDQQPIEVAHLVDACVTAYELTGQQRWSDRVLLGEQWFFGANDGNVWMHDPATGAGFDGLERWGRNDNRGAESTWAFLSTTGQAQHMTAVQRKAS